MKKRKYKEKAQTIVEEIANSITHGLGFALSVSALTILVVYASREGDPWKITAFAIYGSSMTILYLCSTLYHSLTHSRVKAIFRRLDHAAIYLLIAGTYTPVILISLRTTWVIYLLPVVWAMAIIGVYIKVFYIHRYERLTHRIICLDYSGRGCVYKRCYFLYLASITLQSYHLAWICSCGKLLSLYGNALHLSS